MMPPHVREPVPQRVWDATEALDYRPNTIVRGMRTRRTRPIGFSSDEIGATPVAAQILLDVHDLVWDHDFLRFLINTSCEQKLKEATGRVRLNRKVGRMIYAETYWGVVEPRQHLRMVLAILPGFFVEGKSLPSGAPDEMKGEYRYSARVSACCNHRNV